MLALIVALVYSAIGAFKGVFDLALVYFRFTTALVFALSSPSISAVSTATGP